MRLPNTTPLPLETPRTSSRDRIEKAAQELEAQFAHMLVKSMRSASMGDPMLGDNTTYRDMYDQQLARELTKGRGLGLAPLIARQLERSQTSAGTATPAGPLPLAPPAAGLPLNAARATPALTLPAPVAATGGLTLAPSSRGVSMPALAPTAPPPQSAAPARDDDCDPTVPLDCSSPEAFVRSIWPHAKKTARELGVSAKALVAQAALETGWGRRLVGRDANVSSHNLFGIKATGWNGRSVTSATHEFVDGRRRSERADFRAYGSIAESFADYARLLKGQRYAEARDAGHDTRRFATALQKAGYATDPSYATKLNAIANGPTLNRVLSALQG